MSAWTFLFSLTPAFWTATPVSSSRYMKQADYNER
jgi:hypothetical protein